MTVRTRALGALAAGALMVPLLPFSGTAVAAPPDPPPVQNIEQFCAGVPTTPDPFTDIAGNTHERAIECAFAAEIARGGPEELPDTQYGPFRNVRRDQMASFIARMIDKANELDCDGSVRDLPAGDGVVPFTDVPASNTHFRNIDRLQEAGITLGGDEGRPRTIYAPADDIQRDQMASFIHRAVIFMTGAELTDPRADYFTDDETSFHEDNINAIASAGITNGFNGDTYGPFTSVPRDQMASFLIRTLADQFDKNNIRALNGQCPGPTPTPTPTPTPAPFIEDARVATDAGMSTDVADAFGATGTASAGDVFEIDFSEIVATDGAIATEVSFSVEDADGDTATIVCGLVVDVGDNLTSAACDLQGDVLTVTLLEDAKDENTEGDGVLQFDLTITSFDGLVDADGNEVNLTTGDVIINPDPGTAEVADLSPGV